MLHLFHFSEDPTISTFRPRAAKSNHHTVTQAVVWAVGEAGAWAYLAPRNCPRVTFWAQESSNLQDCETFLQGDCGKKVLAIESSWFARCLTTTLYCYEFASESFSRQDGTAEYYISTEEIIPIHMRSITQPLLELTQQNIELRVMPSLWDLRERLFHSTLAWGFIRMAHATEPKQGYGAYLPI